MSFKSEVTKYKQNKTLIQNVNLVKIPKTPGIYIIGLVSNSKIEITEKTTAITKYQTTNLVYPKAELLNKLSLCDKEILYIGKAEAKDNGLYGRIKLLIEYANGENVPHRGGRALWQIKAWKNTLNLYWCEVKDAEKIEKHLLKLHSIEHPNKQKRLSYPFANWRL